MVEVVCHVAVQSEITDEFGKIVVSLSSPFKLAELEQSDDTLSSSYPPLITQGNFSIIFVYCHSL